MKKGSSDKCVVLIMHRQNLEFKELLIPVSVQRQLGTFYP